MLWKHISILPPEKRGQILATGDDLGDEENRYSYSEIELLTLPFTADGRILCQNSGNYVRPNYFKYWMDPPSMKISE